MSKAKILNGKKLANDILRDLRKQVVKMKKRPPALAAILIGDDSASKLYIDLKEKAAQKVGITFHKYLCNGRCYDLATEKEIIEMIKFFNRDKEVDGILIQLPIPKKFSTKKILKTIKPAKDADGFIRNDKKIVPPTVAAIIELLKATGENLKQKKVLAVIKSSEFGRQLIVNLKPLGLKVNIVKNIPPKTTAKKYDIVIIGLGRALALENTHIKKNAIVIDMGINLVKGKILGDVDPNVKEVAGFVSPVPGGVGPLTVACLLRNVYILSKNPKQH